MNIKQQLYDFIDLINSDEPLPDEIESINLGRKDIAKGEYINHADVNWD